MKKIKKGVVDEIVRMYEEDRVSMLYISNYLMLSYMTVWKYLHLRKVDIRPAGGGTYK